MKEKKCFYSKEMFWLSKISHVFLEAYKNPSLCLCQSLGTILPITTTKRNRDVEFLGVNYWLLREEESQPGRSGAAVLFN